MHLEPHAALGWAIGNLGRADRKLRNWCVLGAILPDIDAFPYVFGAQYYGRWHHTFGHNVFSGGLHGLGHIQMPLRARSSAELSRIWKSLAG